MAFVQIVEFRTSQFEEGRKHIDEWERATEGKRTARRALVGKDRNDPNRYFNIVFFDSYESAMENSNLPETQALNEKLTPLAEGPPTFSDLDILEDRDLS